MYVAIKVVVGQTHRNAADTLKGIETMSASAANRHDTAGTQTSHTDFPCVRLGRAFIAPQILGIPPTIVHVHFGANTLG